MRLSLALPRRMHARDLAATCFARSSALALAAASSASTASSSSAAASAESAAAASALSPASSSLSSSSSLRRSSASAGEGSSRKTMFAPAAPPRTKYLRPISSLAIGRDLRYTALSAALPHHSIRDSAQSGRVVPPAGGFLAAAASAGPGFWTAASAGPGVSSSASAASLDVKPFSGVTPFSSDAGARPSAAKIRATSAGLGLALLGASRSFPSLCAACESSTRSRR
mmetsp:Transcript_11934/g.50175  ORF Transcript_11934/g.50175 Transcript_11934/m.50175 type:complete len:227 (-) Transcript_11934:1880-2560(-)